VPGEEALDNVGKVLNELSKRRWETRVLRDVLDAQCALFMDVGSHQPRTSLRLNLITTDLRRKHCKQTQIFDCLSQKILWLSAVTVPSEGGG